MRAGGHGGQRAARRDGRAAARLLALVIHRRWAVLAVWAALAALAAAGLPRLAIDDSAEGFFARDAAALARYHDFRRLFGPDRALRLVLSGPALWTGEGLAWEAELERELTALPGVIGAAGLYAHRRWDEDRWPPADPAAVRAEAVRDPLDRGAGSVSADGTRLSVLAMLWDLDAEPMRELLGQVEALVARSPPGVTTTATGLPVVQRALDVEVTRFATRFFPWLGLLAALLLAVVFRDLPGVLVPLAFVGVSETLLLGTMGWAGARLDMVVIVLVPLAFVVALATAVHVAVRHRQLRAAGASARAAARAAYRDKGWPVLWAGVTTAAGFGSLAVSPVPPVHALGAWSAFAMVLITAAAFTLLPALLAAVAGGRGEGRRLGGGSPFESWARRRGRGWAGWAARRRRPVALAFAAVAVVALAGVGRLGVDRGVLSFFRPDHPVRIEAEALAASGIGPTAGELVLLAGQRRGRPVLPGGSPPPPLYSAPPFDSPQALERLAELSAELAAIPGVRNAVSAGDMVASALPGPPPADDAGRCFALDALRRVPETAPLLATLLTGSGDATRISLGLPLAGFGTLDPALAVAAARARAAFPAAEVFVTGQYPLIVAAQRGVLRTVVISLALTLAVVAAALLLLLRSGRLALAALAPNLWPVAVALGTMGWLAVPLDGSTVMIAAAVLGLAVDDTLHALGAVRRSAGGGRSAAQVVAAALGRTAPGHLLTSALLVAGFAVCTLSPFVPVARFAALTAVGLVAALLADLLLVPALVAAVPAPALARLAAASVTDLTQAEPVERPSRAAQRLGAGGPESRSVHGVREDSREDPRQRR